MSEIIDTFIAEARNVPFEAVAARFGRVNARRIEWAGPCPRCGGEDRYNVNRKKGVWVCRGCGAGGKDAIGLAAHEIGVDVRRQDGLLAACAEVLERPIPRVARPRRRKSARRGSSGVRRRGPRQRRTGRRARTMPRSSARRRSPRRGGFTSIPAAMTGR